MVTKHLTSRMVLLLCIAILGNVSIHALDDNPGQVQAKVTQPKEEDKKENVVVSDTQKMQTPQVSMGTIVSAICVVGMVGGPIFALLKPVQRVGVVTIEGTMTNSAKQVKQLQDFFKNRLIKAIVLKINSGGGSPGAAQAIYYAVRELKKTYNKPVVAWVENIAASGAYYAACSADTIVATPSALVGSVGVISQIWQLKKALQRFDVEQETITSGKYKAFGDAFNDLTPEQRALIQELSNSIYKRFVFDVKQSRPKLAELPIEEWAEGRVFDADRGLELGMVDVLGTQVTVEGIIKHLTKDKREVEFIFPVEPPSFLNVSKHQLSVTSLVDQVCDRLEQRLEQSGQARVKLVG